MRRLRAWCEILDFGWIFDLVTYNNENQKEDKKGQEDELSSALFPHFLFCLNSFYFFFCHVHSDNEGWKEKVLIPAIQWACENCHRWHDPPSCSARLPSNWPRSQDPWRPHGSRWSPAPSSAYPRVWRGKKVPRWFLWVKNNYPKCKFFSTLTQQKFFKCKISWPYIAVVWKMINMSYGWLWNVLVNLFSSDSNCFAAIAGSCPFQARCKKVFYCLLTFSLFEENIFRPNFFFLHSLGISSTKPEVS